MTTRHWYRGVLLATVAFWSCSPRADSAFAFALLGDNPYGQEYVPQFEALIADVNGHADLAWVLHVGDAKGTEPCSDELLQSRFELFQRFALPFVFTPGDNDWYDCREARMGSFDEHDRLAYLREVFFPDAAHASGGRTMALERQSSQGDFSEFVENAMWVRGQVVFATVHLVRIDRPPTDPSIATRRMDAALAWIGKVFEVAAERDARGVLIATQADLWLASGLPLVLERLLSCPQCVAPAPGFERLYQVLVARSVAFARPVVLAVGDTHVFRVDKPLYHPDTGLLIENFTRVETFGHPDVHWVRVTVDPETPEVFSFTQQLVTANVRGTARANVPSN